MSESITNNAILCILVYQEFSVSANTDNYLIISGVQNFSHQAFRLALISFSDRKKLHVRGSLSCWYERSNFTLRLLGKFHKWTLLGLLFVSRMKPVTGVRAISCVCGLRQFEDWSLWMESFSRHGCPYLSCRVVLPIFFKDKPSSKLTSL
jgi:hypothetical protein